MKKLKKLLAINKLSKKDSQWIHKDIFRILRNDDIWIAAFQKLKSNKGALTPVTTTKTIDGMSMERLNKLKDSVCTEKYRFTPVKLIYISAKNKRRPLCLPTVNDKIVQEVMRMILEAIYEPIFVETSFGLRSGLGYHDALYHVENKFRWVDYVIKGDIEQVYSTIDNKILVKILEKRINDPRFIRLIWKLLGCGLLDQERIIWSKTGVPQDSIISPILVNIYYHELDLFVNRIKIDLETTQKDRKNLKSKEYKSLEHKITKVSKGMRRHEPHSSEYQKLAKQLKILRKKRLETNTLKNKVIRIEYVRYADDWMIGVAGDMKLVFNIRHKVTEFIRIELDQKVHSLQTKIINLRKGNAHFLEYDIFLPMNRPILSYKGKGVKTIRRGQPQLQFDIPVNKLVARYIERGYFKQLTNKVRPISRASYTVLEDHVIVSHYRKLWFGIYNYYSGCTRRGRLKYIHYLLHMSCAMTLGHRHRKSCSKIFKEHGKTLTVKIPNTDKKVSFPYKTSWKIKERKWLRGIWVTRPTYHYASLILRSSLDLPCAICDSKERSQRNASCETCAKKGIPI